MLAAREYLMQDRLPSVRPRRLVRPSKRAGFEGHHEKGSLPLAPVQRKMTSAPLHPRDLPRGTLRAILSQVGLSREELLELL